ncbi:MAG: alpha/beta hydrolase [Bacteroidota bacterium]
MNLRTRFFLKMILIAFSGVLSVILLGIVIEFIILRGTTPQIVDNEGRLIPRSVASLEQISLGGIHQTILVRGADSTNPVILFLHGGPGMPAMFLAHSFQQDLEQDFVIVHWDRRGAGKSYFAGVESDSITLRQTLNDTYDLTTHLRHRFEKNRIVLVAHSWGTLLGLLAVKEHPEYYSAYVGMGQLSADSLRRYVVQRRFLYNMAKAHRDNGLMERILHGERITEDDLFRYGGEIHAARGYGPILMAGLWAPEYDLFDILNVPKGASMVSRRMREDVPVYPLEETLGEFSIPIYFFLGRHDYNTPSVLAAEYFRDLQAPAKELIWFEYSAHFPFWEEPGKFTAEMRRLKTAIRGFWNEEVESLKIR